MLRPAEKEETKTTQETTLNFNDILETDKALFMAGLSPDKTKLNLKDFEAGDCPEISRIETFLQNNSQVTHFRWGGAHVSDSKLGTLVSIPSLKSLELPDCTQVTDTGMQALRGNTTLESLKLLSCNQITDTGLKSLAMMQGIKSLVLDVGANPINLQTFSNMLELRSLTLFCSGIQVADFPALKSLTLMGVTLTDKDCFTLKNNNPDLNLALNACTGITDACKNAIKEAEEKASIEEKEVRENNAALFAFLKCAKGAAKKTLVELATDKVEQEKAHLGEVLRGPLYGNGEQILGLMLEQIALPRPRPRPVISFKSTFH